MQKESSSTALKSWRVSQGTLRREKKDMMYQKFLKYQHLQNMYSSNKKTSGQVKYKDATASLLRKPPFDLELFGTNEREAKTLRREKNKA